MNEQIIAAYWQQFLKDTGRELNTKYFEAFYFDLNERTANALLKLVLDGKKKATASSLYYFENSGSPLPEVGSLSIITDFQGIPHCVIETTQVTILPFKDMTFEICSREGEDDNLASWQKNHVHFFTEEGRENNYEFSWDMPVVFEDFEVIYR